jgi:hypothetical protein
MTKSVARSQRSIDQLIEDVTVDCYNDDKQRAAFVVAFGQHLERKSAAALHDVELKAGTDADLVAPLQAYRHWCRQ